MSKKLITGLCRLSYAHLFQPHADLNGKEKYSASLIIPKSDKATLGRYQQAIDEMLKDPDVKRTATAAATASRSATVTRTVPRILRTRIATSSTRVRTPITSPLSTVSRGWRSSTRTKCTPAAGCRPSCSSTHTTRAATAASAARSTRCASARMTRRSPATSCPRATSTPCPAWMPIPSSESKSKGDAV